MIFKNINSEDISGLIICSEPPISSSAIRTKETTIDGRDGAIVEKLGYKTRIRNVEIGLKKDANVDKILSYFSGEGDLIFKNENDKVYKAAIYEQVDLERLLRLRKGSVAFYCQPFKYKRNDIFETIKDNKVKEKKGKHLELLNCAEQNVVDLKLEGSTNQATRSGKNLLDNTATTKISNGITFTVNSDGTVLADGTNDTTANSSLIINRYDLSPGTYVLNGCPSGGAINTYRLAIQETGSYSVLGSIDIGNGSREFTIDTTTNVQISIFIQKGLTINNLLFKPMLREATIADDTYEQYGASPSPDYPSPIENVEGKNKFDINQEKEILGTMLYKYSYYLKPNTKYTISSNCPASTTANIYANSNSSNSAVYINKNQTIQSDENGYFYILVRFNADASDNSTFNLYEKVLNGTYYIQLEEGTVATPYVPYNSLEIKDIGENLFNISKVQNVNDDVANCTLIEKNANGVKIQGATSTSTDIFAWSKGWYCPSYSEASKEAQVSIKEPCTIKLSADVTLLETVTEPRIRMNLRKVNGDAILADSTVLNLNKKTRIEKTFKVTSGKFSPFFALCSNTFLIENIMISTTGGEYKPYQEQKVTFPLSEGQKLYEGSYLASDGIHHKRKQTTVTIQNIVALSNGNVGGIFQFTGKKYSNNNVLCCDKAKHDPNRRFVTDTVYENQANVAFVGDSTDTLETLKAKYDGAILEYELATEETVPYTAEQQEAYNQLQKLKLYKGQNTMFSLEGSIINLKYLEDTDEKVENQGNIYSKPIIRLEKTVFKEVEIAINGIRFKYNFEEDDYVEIDCEEMTVQYEGLDRNRRLVIDFEFPKLKEGNNDIVMYSGDCIIKCKRKDRWL